MDINEWLDRAGSCVPGPKERAAVRQELLDHYRDRLDALLGAGLDPGAATEKALAALGDPDETGRLLRRVHGPWLTWLLRGVRILLFALILVLIVNPETWQGLKNDREAWRTRDAYVAGAPFGVGENGQVLLSYRKGSCETVGETADHQVAVLAAWNLWYGEPQTGNGLVHQECYIVLRVDTPRWETSPWDNGSGLERSLRITADGEDAFVSYSVCRETRPDAAEDRTTDCFYGSRLCRNLLSCDYLLIVERRESLGADGEPSFDPERLELIWEAGGEGFTLPVVFGPRTEGKGGLTP